MIRMIENLDFDAPLDSNNLKKIPYKEGTKNYINEVGKWLYYQCTIDVFDSLIPADAVGVRFHRGGNIPEIGEEIRETSYEWVDDQITDIELGGLCAVIVVRYNKFLFDGTEIFDGVLPYKFGDGQVIIISGGFKCWGDENPDEVVIKDPVRLA